MTIRRSSSSRASVPWLRIRAAVVSILPTRRPTSYGEQFRASDEGKMYSRVSNLRLRRVVRERGARVGLVGTGTGVCGSELYYGNYMINTTRPWALSSPSRSSFQSRSSARSSLHHHSGSNLAPLSRLSTRRYCRSSHPPSSHSPPLVRSVPSPFPRASIGGLP